MDSDIKNTLLKDAFFFVQCISDDFLTSFNSTMLTLGFCSGLLLIYVFLIWIRRYVRVDKFGEKYVLVTGCDSGFGQILVQRLDMLGFNVFAGL